MRRTRKPCIVTPSRFLADSWMQWWADIRTDNAFEPGGQVAGDAGGCGVPQRIREAIYADYCHKAPSPAELPASFLCQSLEVVQSASTSGKVSLVVSGASGGLPLPNPSLTGTL